MPLFRRRRDDVVVEPSPPEPISRDEVARRLVEAVPGSGPGLAEGLLPAVRLAIRREPDAAIDIAHSKLGGAPDLPRGTPWPMWTGPDGQRRELQFFAQLDLAAMAAATSGPLDLPADGQLSFFAAVDDGGAPTFWPGAAAAVYSPASAPLSRCGLRMVPLPTAELAAVGAWSWPAPADPAALDPLEADYAASLQASLPEGYHLSGRHQVGGHCAAPQQLSLEPGEVAVLRFDSDGELEIAWGGPGRAGALVWTLPRSGVGGVGVGPAGLRLVGS